jgi:hypothetical protein
MQLVQLKVTLRWTLGEGVMIIVKPGKIHEVLRTDLRVKHHIVVAKQHHSTIIR